MSLKIAIDELFGSRILYPDIEYQERLSRLIGLDNHKERLSKIIGLLVNPESLENWAKKHHPEANGLLKFIMQRPPLIVLEGDVGSGKTELAETIGDAVARSQKIEITLFPLSLSTRGQGRVGEMTQLLSAAFEYTIKEAKKLKSNSGKARGAIILLVDEADALAQSREAAQMHHEDRAGVNAFIRGIDQIGNGHLPVAVIMCTNRIGSLDPAIKRRAAEILTFCRPSLSQRHSLISNPLKTLGFSPQHIDAIAVATGSTNGRNYGFTFSDIIQRLLPTIVIDAYPMHSVDPVHAVEIAKTLAPTPPFQEGLK